MTTQLKFDSRASRKIRAFSIEDVHKWTPAEMRLS